MFSTTKLFIFFYLLATCIVMLGGLTPVHAAVRNYKFELRNTPYSRLCSNKTMLTVNGQSPGPIIYARRGDLIIIDVINNSDQKITIHCHGVKMPRYPWSDGTEYVTQCPITPGAQFKQRIILSDEEGTLWWHAHTDWFRNSVYGAIVILPPKHHTFPFPRPHAQFPVLIGEWWKNDVQKVLEGFLESGGDPEESDAFLINGQPGDLYPCSKQDTHKLVVEFGKTYLIRLVNAVMDHIMFFSIANHSVTVVGADAAYTKPLKTDYVAISPGQTLDLLLEANQAASHYYMGARVYSSGGVFVATPATGIIEYVGNHKTPPPSPLLPSFPDFGNRTASFSFTNKLRSLGDDVEVPKNVTKNLFFTLSVNQWPERILASVNNVTMVLPRIDVLQAYYRGIGGVYTTDFPDNPPFPFDYAHDKLPKYESLSELGTAVSVLEYNATVEIVFQGTILAGGVEHPMHLHGYSFYVVGSGLGNFDPTKDPANYNLVDPPLMENIAVPMNGWTAIRFKANNPGVWYMHCHFQRHQTWGMGMVFIVKDGERPDEKMLPPPRDMPRCAAAGGQPSSDPLLSSHHLAKFNNPVVESN